VLGVAMLLQPKRIGLFVAAGGATPPAAVVRVLGTRELVQGAVILAQPERRAFVTAGSAVDLLHGTSMLAVATWWPRYRRPALASAGIAGCSAVAGALTSWAAVR